MSLIKQALISKLAYGYKSYRFNDKQKESLKGKLQAAMEVEQDLEKAEDDYSRNYWNSRRPQSTGGVVGGIGGGTLGTVSGALLAKAISSNRDLPAVGGALGGTAGTVLGAIGGSKLGRMYREKHKGYYDQFSQKANTAKKLVNKLEKVHSPLKNLRNEMHEYMDSTWDSPRHLKLDTFLGEKGLTSANLPGALAQDWREQFEDARDEAIYNDAFEEGRRDKEIYGRTLKKIGSQVTELGPIAQPLKDMGGAALQAGKAALPVAGHMARSGWHGNRAGGQAVKAGWSNPYGRVAMTAAGTVAGLAAAKKARDYSHRQAEIQGYPGAYPQQEQVYPHERSFG